MKTCAKCGEAKPREMFSADKRKKDGLRSHCKACDGEYQRRRYAENAEAAREYQRRYYEANADAKRERQRRWREQNADAKHEYDRRWREQNAEAAREYARIYSKANPHIDRARNARRRASLAQSTPAWSDGALIVRIYRVASLATRAFGEQFDVDHIVPLRGKNATGLHAHTNLRVIPSTENVRKHAKLDEALALDRAALARSLGALILRANAVRKHGI